MELNDTLKNDIACCMKLVIEYDDLVGLLGDDDYCHIKDVELWNMFYDFTKLRPNSPLVHDRTRFEALIQATHAFMLDNKSTHDQLRKRSAQGYVGR